MSAPLDSLIAKLEKIQEVSENAMVEAVERSEETLVKLQKERMDLGLDVNGNPIEYNKPRRSELNSTGAYTKSYDKYKSSKGKQTRVVDLELTGSYKRGIQAETKKGFHEVNVDISSNSETAKFVEKNYDNIYGLDKSQQTLIENDISKEVEMKVTNFLNR